MLIITSSTAYTQYSSSSLVHVFLSSLTASISSWSGISLNISDFSWFAKSHSDEILGLLAFPLALSIYSFADVAVTSSTVTIFGHLITNPTQLFKTIGGTFTIVLATFGISLAPITTNIPCNLVPPSNVLLSLFPSNFNFIHGAILPSLIALAFQPWRILGSSENFVYAWLGGMVLDVNSLCCDSDLGHYYYVGGFNLAVFGALIISVTPCVPDFIRKVGILKTNVGALFNVVIYDISWSFLVFSLVLLFIGYVVIVSK
ncbi:putative purine-cytosine permease [Dioscorea sansibarensis]